MDRSWVRIVASGLFLAISIVWIYWGENQGPHHSLLRTLPDGLALAIWMGSYLLMGFLVGRWWAIPLAFLPILVAVPAGASELDEDRMAISQMLVASTLIGGAPLTAIGLVARWVMDGATRRRSSGAAGAPG
jgi:hypothetical protein